MPVAGDDLRRDRVGLESEALAGDPFDLRVDRGIRADGPRQLSDAARLERALDARACAVELERPACKLPAEGGRLGVDPVRATDANRPPVLLCAPRDSDERAVDALQDEGAGGADL